MKQNISKDILTFSIKNGKIQKTNIEISDRSLLIYDSELSSEELICFFNVN